MDAGMFFVAEADGFSIVIDIIGKILLPLLSGVIAVYAIYKIDLRERHKRRRDAVVATAVEFMTATDNYGDLYRSLLVNLLQNAATDELSRFDEAALKCQRDLSACGRKLEITGEQQLFEAINAFLTDFRTNRDNYRQLLGGIEHTVTQEQLAQGFALNFAHVERARVVVEEFKASVARLDYGTFGWIDKGQAYLSGR
jgi:hypothetical protein